MPTALDTAVDAEGDLLSCPEGVTGSGDGAAAGRLLLSWDLGTLQSSVFPESAPADHCHSVTLQQASAFAGCPGLAWPPGSPLLPLGLQVCSGGPSGKTDEGSVLASSRRSGRAPGPGSTLEPVLPHPFSLCADCDLGGSLLAHFTKGSARLRLVLEPCFLLVCVEGGSTLIPAVLWADQRDAPSG